MIGSFTDKTWWSIVDYLWDDPTLESLMTTCSQMLKLIQIKFADKICRTRQTLIRIYGEPGCRHKETPVTPCLSWRPDPFEAMMIEKIMIKDYGSFHVLDGQVREHYGETKAGARMLLGCSKEGKRHAVLNYFREHPNVYWVSIIGGLDEKERFNRDIAYQSLTYEQLQKDEQLLTLDQALDVILWEYNHGGQI